MRSTKNASGCKGTKASSEENNLRKPAHERKYPGQYAAWEKRKAAEPWFNRQRSRFDNIRRQLFALANGTGTDRHYDFIGCSLGHFKRHLEAAFTPGVTWRDTRSFEFHHVIPIGKTGQRTEEETARLYHYSNFQPLTKAEHRRLKKKRGG